MYFSLGGSKYINMVYEILNINYEFVDEETCVHQGTW